MPAAADPSRTAALSLFGSCDATSVPAGPSGTEARASGARAGSNAASPDGHGGGAGSTSAVGGTCEEDATDTAGAGGGGPASGGDSATDRLAGFTATSSPESSSRTFHRATPCSVYINSKIWQHMPFNSGLARRPTIREATPTPRQGSEAATPRETWALSVPTSFPPSCILTTSDGGSASLSIFTTFAGAPFLKTSCPLCSSSSRGGRRGGSVGRQSGTLGAEALFARSLLGIDGSSTNTPAALWAAVSMASPAVDNPLRSACPASRVEA